jgi:hypothetical protein
MAAEWRRSKVLTTGGPVVKNLPLVLICMRGSPSHRWLSSMACMSAAVAPPCARCSRRLERGTERAGTQVTRPAGLDS